MAAYKIFIGGGGDDWISRVVKTYYQEYAAKNRDYKCFYHSWTAPEDVEWQLRLLSRDASITVVGHSYGGDCALGALPRCGRVVDTLVSIDPVGRFRPSWTSIRSSCRRWLNVRAEPSDRNWHWNSDGISALGGQYPRPPGPGQAGSPNFSLVVDTTHANFRTMMRGTTREGISGRYLLGGNHVA